jgi:signal transduction histidine kinase
MLAPRNLQSKLLVSVFLIVSIVVTCLTALVIYVEKGRFEKKEMDRIYYATDAMKKRLGHLIYGKNWRYLMITLSNAKAADQSMLYFAVTGEEGQVLVSDRELVSGSDAFDFSRRLAPKEVLYHKASQTNTGDFWIYLARYFPGGRGGSDPDSGEIIFEAVHDIVYLGEQLGQLRVGFSRDPITQHLAILTAVMLGTGALVLAVILALIYGVIRVHMAPVASLISSLSSLDLSREGISLSEGLLGIPLDRQPGETRDVQQLKQAFEHLRSQLIDACNQLENHRSNLERMVEKRTEDLNRQIQERKEIEARLLTVQKLEAIGTLAGGIAHEFNNLFMAITGYATLIQKRVAPDHPNVEKAEKIRRLVETGSQSVQQLLGFARSGKFEPGPLNLNEVVRGSLVMLTHSRKSLEIDARCQEDLWTVQADRSQMEQVVMNLLLNASDAMPGNGTITVETCNRELAAFKVSLDKSVSGKFTCLRVLDQGAGIEPALLPRIFDPFFTTKEMGKGSGMGLASVFGIVENHGGFTTVDSEPGRGSCFSVYLPALFT